MLSSPSLSQFLIIAKIMIVHINVKLKKTNSGLSACCVKKGKLFVKVWTNKRQHSENNKIITDHQFEISAPSAIFTTPWSSNRFRVTSRFRESFYLDQDKRIRSESYKMSYWYMKWILIFCWFVPLKIINPLHKTVCNTHLL